MHSGSSAHHPHLDLADSCHQSRPSPQYCCDPAGVYPDASGATKGKERRRGRSIEEGCGRVCAGGQGAPGEQVWTEEMLVSRNGTWVKAVAAVEISGEAAIVCPSMREQRMGQARKLPNAWTTAILSGSILPLSRLPSRTRSAHRLPLPLISPTSFRTRPPIPPPTQRPHPAPSPHPSPAPTPSTAPHAAPPRRVWRHRARRV
ncbi:hypothetical protein B0H16DRAFT_1510662 [Mycena metata]|uniref:Uncharacterized protein n=1 Tax=Mycena metata TaxID=1033252 RepID=A0AAD7NT36_9AGAR|nr:hypothetical protein B0H16DRAFT_1510662 [Mycena metata]